MTKNIIVDFEDESVRKLEAALKEISPELFANQGNIEFLVGFTDVLKGEPRLKVEVFAKEHGPPHFRVKAGGKTANFTIEECEVLNGTFNKKQVVVVKEFWKKNQCKIIKCWDESRPGNCPVGKYKGTKLNDCE